jgi:hypothetical protein
VEFLLVYVREAHPTDGWQLPRNEREGALLPQARSADEKDSHATACVRKLHIEFPTLVDNMDNRVELEYSGWPDRMYLVGKDGRIAWKGRPGPAGFRPPELEAAILKELGSTAGR